MGRLLVRRAGLLTTVQDLGRPGLGRFGVSPSGAMDPLALRAANRMVGNAEGAAGLEITAVGPEVVFLDRTLVALAGGNLLGELDGVPLEPWTPATAGAGQVLTFRGRRQGARAYLALAGGLAVDAVMGSSSTDIECGFGGLHGRPLREGDELATLPATARRPREAHPALLREYADPFTLRFVPEPERTEAAHALAASSFRVGSRSNRVGYRLEGPALPIQTEADALSEGIPPGAIQVPPDGRPILLMAERPTVGGYPRVGTLILADVPRAAQLWLGHVVRFTPCTTDEARRALAGQEAALARSVGP